MLTTAYRKSSRSNTNGSCVEARQITEGVEMRDSKDPAGPTLRVPGAAWGTFAAAVPTRDGWGYGR